MKNILMCFFFVLLFTGVIFSSVSSLENYIERQMEKGDIPALSILISENSNILYQKCFGMADIERHITLNKDHMFLIASISKVVTATALMQLYDKGYFDLDDPVNHYLGFNVKNPVYNDPITFRMLLTHTSSIADGSAMDDQYYYGKDSPVALKTYLKQYFTPGLKYYDDYENFYDYKPGEDFEYSNTGSTLIALLVESISGQDFNTYCREKIFKPLNMLNSHWKLSEINTREIVRPYDYDLEPLEHYTFTDYPNGGLRTTANDLFKLMAVYVNQGSYNGYRLLKKDTVDMMLSPQIKAIDPSVGLHFFRMNKRYDLWGHDGGEEGVSTMMAFNRDKGIGVIILTNMSDVNLDDILVKAFQTGIELSE